MDKRRKILIGKNYIFKNENNESFVIKIISSNKNDNNINIKAEYVRELNASELISNKKYYVSDKYIEIYKSTKDKKSFILSCLQKLPGIKRTTILRRYYYLKNSNIKQGEYYEHGTLNIKKYLEDDKSKPNYTKILALEDFKKQGRDITQRITLTRTLGFSNAEINWLEEEGYLKP